MNNSDFEKIRVDAISKSIRVGSNSEFDDIVNEIIDITSKITMNMLIKYHESLNPTKE